MIQSKRVQEDGVASYLGLSSVLTILLDMALRYRTSQILNYLSFQKKKAKICHASTGHNFAWPSAKGGYKVVSPLGVAHWKIEFIPKTDPSPQTVVSRMSPLGVAQWTIEFSPKSDPLPQTVTQ